MGVRATSDQVPQTAAVGDGGVSQKTKGPHTCKRANHRLDDEHGVVRRLLAASLAGGGTCRPCGTAWAAGCAARGGRSGQAGGMAG